MENDREHVGIPESEAVAFLQVLQQRFKDLTELRTMTAHRHITLIGVVGAFMAGVFQLGGAEGQKLVAQLLPPASLILLLLGGCVTIYDAMIRRRASAVMTEMSRVLKITGAHVYRHQKGGFISWWFNVLDEDFFFFSQILLVNGLTAVPLVMRVHEEDSQKIKIIFGFEGYVVYLAAVVLFGGLWFAARRAYDYWGPANNWFPRA